MQSIKHTGLAMVLGCAAMLVTPFAAAGQGRHGDHHGRHGGNDAAVGIALVIGAAALISASSNHRRTNYQDSRYGNYGNYGGSGNYGSYSIYGSGYDNAGFSTTVTRGGRYDRGAYYPSGRIDPSYAAADYGTTAYAGDSYDYGSNAESDYDQGYADPEYYDAEGGGYCEDDNGADYDYEADRYPR